MLRTLFFGSVIFFLAFITSCKSEGTGGKAAFKVRVLHNGAIINSGTIYVKYGSNVNPGNNPTDYNTQNNISTDGTLRYSGMVKGDYYIYVAGYNTDLNVPVYGGTGITITKKDNIEVDINVSE